MSNRQTFVQNAAIAIFAASGNSQMTDSHGRTIAETDAVRAARAIERAEVLASAMGVVNEVATAELPETTRRTGTERASKT